MDNEQDNEQSRTPRRTRLGDMFKEYDLPRSQRERERFAREKTERDLDAWEADWKALPERWKRTPWPIRVFWGAAVVLAGVWMVSMAIEFLILV
jgi:hypothetical protein